MDDWLVMTGSLEAVSETNHARLAGPSPAESTPVKGLAALMVIVSGASNVGWPTIWFFAGRGKSASGVAAGVPLTCSARTSPVRFHTRSKGGASFEGNRERNSSKSAAFAGAADFPTGRLNSSFASPGTQISSHTSQDAAARRVTVPDRSGGGVIVVRSKTRPL